MSSNDPKNSESDHSEAQPEKLCELSDSIDRPGDLNDFSETVSNKVADSPTPGVSDSSGNADVGVTKPPSQDQKAQSGFEVSPTIPSEQETIPASVGRYEIRGVLGRGGFGAVYHAFDAQLERHVAVKVPLLRGDVKE